MISTPSSIGGDVMRLAVLSLVSLSLLIPGAAAEDRKTQKGAAKDTKIEARGTIKMSTRTLPTKTKPAIFVMPPNPCAPDFIFEKDMERYKAMLAVAESFQGPRIHFEALQTKAVYSIRQRD